MEIEKMIIEVDKAVREAHKDFVDALTALKIRISYIGLPSEPHDWAKECALLEKALYPPRKV